MVKLGQQGSNGQEARIGGIAGTKGWEELYTMLRGMQAYNRGLKDRGNYALVGSDGKLRYTAEEIIAEIEKKRRGDDSKQLTRSGGLRNKVAELLVKEVAEGGASLAEKTDFYRKWNPTVQTFATSNHFNAPAHVTFALEIVGRQLGYRGNPTDVMLLQALQQADEAIKRSESGG